MDDEPADGRSSTKLIGRLRCMACERAPLLRDYIDDEVSAWIDAPVTQKVVVIQALEVHTLG